MLTRSIFNTNQRCSKAAYLEANGVQPKMTDDDTHRMAVGMSIKTEALKLWPCDIIPLTANKWFISLSSIASKLPVIKRSWFVHDNKQAIIDVLEWDKATESYHMIGIKSGTSPKEKHFEDLAYQAHIAISCGVPISKVSICQLNSLSVHPSANHFSVTNITEEVLPRTKLMEKQLNKLINVIQLKEPPKVSHGKHCSKDGDCGFKKTCGYPEGVNLWNIPRLSDSKLKMLNDLGFKSIDDFKSHEIESVNLTDKQKEFLALHVNKDVFFDKASIKAEFNTWHYPLHYLDFETEQYAIPKLFGTTPYEQTPFQYSLTIIHKDGRIEKKGYLHTSESDPRRALAESLAKNLEGHGSVVAYYKSFESKVLRKLASENPDLAPVLFSANDCLVDLWDVVRKYVDHYAFNGSTSIKAVLPVIVPELSYKILEVQNGMAAQVNWRKLVNEADAVKKQKMVVNAKLYCDLDVHAMVEIHQQLSSI